MAFSQFKTALKRAIKLEKGPRIALCHASGTALWVATGVFAVNCSEFSEAEKTIIRHEVSVTADNVRELKSENWEFSMRRWVGGKRKPVERTHLLWIDEPCSVNSVPIQLLTAEHGTCGAQVVYLEVMAKLADTEHFMIDWGGYKTVPLRIRRGKQDIGFIMPVVWNDPAPAKSALESILAGLPVPDEVSG